MKICVLIMAYNEAHCIGETLLSTLSIASEYIIIDHYSTDDTMKICNDFFDKHSVKGTVYQKEWKDFGTNYSYLYEYGFRYSTCDYLYQIDADDIIVGNMDVHNLTEDAYAVQFNDDGTVYIRYQLFKNNILWRHRMCLHGYVTTSDLSPYTKGMLSGDYYVVSRRLGNRHQNIDRKTKYGNDARQIEEALKGETYRFDMVRYYFYLGQSYMCAEQYQNAINAYLKRISYGGWEEELYYARLMIATCHILLGEDNKAIRKYRRCHQLHSDRAEPLYDIALIYKNQKLYKESNTILKQALLIPFPSHRTLFQLKYVYDYGIYQLMAYNYWYLNKLSKCLNICNQLEKLDLPDDTKRDIERLKKWC